jgi:hypothetical protein
MHFWPILFAILLLDLIVGFAMFYAGGAPIQNSDSHQRLDLRHETLTTVLGSGNTPLVGGEPSSPARG